MAWVRDQIASFVNSVLVPHLWAISTMPRVTSEMVGGGSSAGDLYASPPYVALSTAVRCIDQVRALQSNPGIGHCEHHMLRLLIDGGSGRAVGFGALPLSAADGKGVQPSGLIPSICERQLYSLIESLTTLTNASAMGVIAAVLEAAKSAAPSSANNKINCTLSPSVMAAYLSLDGDLFNQGGDKPDQPPSAPSASPWGRAVRVLHNDLSEDVQVAVRATCAFIVTDISRQNLAACRQLYGTLVGSSSSETSSSKISLLKISRFGTMELGSVRSSHHASDHTFAPHTLASLVSLLLVPHTAYTRPQQPGSTAKQTVVPPVAPTATTSFSRGKSASSAQPSPQPSTATTTSVLLSPNQLSPSHTLFLRSACGIGPTARGFIRSVNELCSMLSVSPSGAPPSAQTSASSASSTTTTNTTTPTLLLCREYVSLCDSNLGRLLEGFLVGYTSNVSSTLHHTLDKAVVSIRGPTTNSTQQPSIVVAAGIVSSTAAMAGAAQLALFSDALCGVLVGALALSHVDATVGRVPHFTNKPVLCTPQCSATRRLGFSGRGTKAPLACEALRSHAIASLSRTLVAALASLGLAHAAPGVYSPSTARTNGTPTVSELTASGGGSSSLPFLHGDLRRWKASTILQEAFISISNEDGIMGTTSSSINSKTSMDTGLLIRALLDAFVYSPYRPSDSTPSVKSASTTTTAPTPGAAATVRWLFWRAVGSPDSARECSVRHLIPRYPTFPLRIPTVTTERSEQEAAMDQSLIELLRDENNLLKGAVATSSTTQRGVTSTSSSTSSPNLAMAHYAIQISLKLLSAAQTILVGPLTGGGGNDPSEGTQLSGMWAFLRDVCMSPLVFTTNPDPAHWRNVIGGMLQPYISSSWEKDMRSSWLQSRGCLSNDSPTGAATFPSVVVLLQVLIALLMKVVFSQGSFWDRVLLGAGSGRAWHYRTGRARDDAVSHILTFFGVMRYIWQPLFSGGGDNAAADQRTSGSLIGLITSITSEVMADVEAVVTKPTTTSEKDEDGEDGTSSQWGALEEVITRAPEVLFQTHNIPLGGKGSAAMLDSRPEVQTAVDAARTSVNIRYHCATGDVALEEHQKSRARREREREEAEARADPMPEPPKMAELNNDDLESTKAELDLTSALAQLQAEGDNDDDPSKAEERDQKLLALSRELAQFEREKIQRRKKREASMKQLQGEHVAQLEGYQRELEAYKHRRAESARLRALADETANRVSDFLGIEQLRALVCELVAPLNGTI